MHANEALDQLQWVHYVVKTSSLIGFDHDQCRILILSIENWARTYSYLEVSILLNRLQGPDFPTFSVTYVLKKPLNFGALL